MEAGLMTKLIGLYRMIDRYLSPYDNTSQHDYLTVSGHSFTYLGDVVLPGPIRFQFHDNYFHGHSFVVKLLPFSDILTEFLRIPEKWQVRIRGFPVTRRS